MANPDAAIAEANPVGFFFGEPTEDLRHVLFFFPLELAMDIESESFPPAFSRFGFSVCVRVMTSGEGDCGGLKLRIAFGDSDMGVMEFRIPASSIPEDAEEGTES